MSRRDELMGEAWARAVVVTPDGWEIGVIRVVDDTTYEAFAGTDVPFTRVVSDRCPSAKAALDDLTVRLMGR